MNKLTNVDYSYINWGPFVMKTILPDYIIKRLKTDGDKTKKKYNAHLAGHLKNQFKYNEKTIEWFYNETQPIFSAYRESHCIYHGIENLQVELNANDLWINYMKPGDFNPVHTHGGDYSFVTFVDVPKQLEKEMQEFEGTSTPPGSINFEFTQQARPQWATTGKGIIPKTGDMYIFPALLQHWVAPFKSKITRISVSGNLAIMNRHKLPRDYW